MPSRRENSGFQSSAGLMRYFDTENDKGLRLSPTAVIGIAIALIAVVLLLGVFFPLSD